jgi:glycosyltransferase involved in cell wall biosynthesis
MSAAAVVSCVMPTSNRPWFVQRALTYFLRAADLDSELIVVDDGNDPCIIPAADSRVRCIRLPGRRSIGAKRNVACEHARGTFIVHWDDDDWYAAWRIGYQVQELRRTGADVCGLDRLLYYEPVHERAWEYAYPRKRSCWVAGNTLCYRKSFWMQHPFADVDVGEDWRFVSECEARRIHRHSRTGFVVGLIHEANTSPKRTSTGRWHARPVRDVEQLMGLDVQAYRNGPRGRSTSSTALVATGKGIGDILRITPLVRALHDSGRAVDVLIAPDYPETTALLEGAPEIRQLFAGSPPTDRTYDDGVFAWWGRQFLGRVAAARVHVIEHGEWMAEGESGWIARVAHSLGCAVPARPFARHSGRTFDLPPGTIALHPGCKADWPWKKWHGFDELAAMLDDVVVVGTPEDVDNSRTWFRRPFTWPAHARNYIGELSLADTAALLTQCAALVSNDSGLMHLGAALGIPTLGIFGITNPEREAMPTPHLVALSKHLPCEPACRRERWGRRDCEHHLQCLKTLTPIEVRDRLMGMLKDEVMTAERSASVTPGRSRATIAGLRLAYYGHVFDASGYGAAARAYIHALQTAGVDVQVINLTKGPPAVRDELIESLATREVVPDLRLFHGIPALWAAEAFPHPHYIAMTVWETTMMPPQWRNALRRALDVWLPCDFNVRVFERALGRPVLKLPHPVPPPPAGVGDVSSLRLDPDDILFYSVFEWQDRKGPFEQMVAFLRAFSDGDRAVLVLKTGPSAASEAQAALLRARQTTGSKARVLLCCDAWSDATVAALHARGDCYVSLHRGEGWGYPLFEAAVRGTPVVATAFGGPLDYLDRTHHRLVSYRVVPVRQRYVFYNGAMDWADPDVAEAAGHLRWIYDHLGEARRLAEEAAASLRARYAPAVIGAQARDRLIELLNGTDSRRWEEVSSHQAIVRLDASTDESRTSLRPPVPIPGSWFDADYFEYGRKSNWSRGYTWREFRGLFGETAAFLTSTFPNARTYFDAGCAKGFLIRALRDAGKEAWGCDLSEWAYTHAEESGRPFITLGAAEDIRWSDSYDVLTMFHVLTQMTEQQIDRFLSRARPHIRIAMLAVIPLIREGETAPEGDLAHITWRGRAWWHERFVRAGWRQDLLHDAMEELSQRHPLPGRLGWELFLYSPGQG